ncbi:hypothetical protein [Methanoregula sp.]|jgi:hypothetical protein|uniref:hypothetical protein n=1 Tax=Methanoregula sp. TaxID=2052170 RepID=UPI0035658187
MVLSSDCTALITQRKLDELNDEYDRNAAVVRVISQPLDPDTEPEVLCEKRIARGN